MEGKETATHTDRETMSSQNAEEVGNLSFSEPSDSYERKLERRILRRVDIRLLPILGSLYTISLIDRSNISVARISGLDQDVGLAVGNRASIALLVFFIGYIIFEIPSNIVIKKVGAANWLAFIAFAWGVITIGIGFLHSWVDLAVLRAFLGVLEAGFFPGCVYLVSSWYCRYEVQKRLAGFFLLAQALSAFANILAYGIIQIANHTTYKGWRWIYIIEGSITCVLAILSWFIIIDFPHSNRNTFLTNEEKAVTISRLQQDRGTEENEKVTWWVIWGTILDWKIWSFSFMYMSGAIGVYAFLFFLPIILKDGLGYSTVLAFTLSAPPALFSVIEAMFISWLADRLHMRGVFVVTQGLVGIIGLCMTGFLHHPTPRYVGTFLGEAGVNGLVVTTLAWQANNIRGDAKRSVASAIQIMISAIGGIYSSLVFRQQDAPDYVPGIIAVMAVCATTVVLAAITMLILEWANKQADQGRRVLEGLDTFRYTP